VDIPGRKTLPHIVPLWIDPQQEIYFITVACQNRHANQLALPEVSARLIESVRHRHEQSLWYPWLFLLMPDHLHALISFPPSGKPLKSVIDQWKRWTCKETGVTWQRNFFEHRLRPGDSRREKADYILQNPVRAGLVSRAEDWPFVYFAKDKAPPFDL
jgi:REP element-mobilizing transposase RayT